MSDPDEKPSWLPFPKENSTTRLKSKKDPFEKIDLTLGMGGEIRRIREIQHMTQDELALKVGISRTSVTNIESGNQKLSLVLLEAIAQALDCEVFIELRQR